MATPKNGEMWECWIGRARERKATLYRAKDCWYRIRGEEILDTNPFNPSAEIIPIRKLEADEMRANG